MTAVSDSLDAEPPTAVADRLHPGRVLDYGNRALMLEFGDTAQVLAWADEIRRAALPGVVDVVPAAQTVLVTLERPTYLAPTRQRLAQLRIDPATVEAGPAGHHADITIDVVYDGADLAEVAALTGLTPAQVVAAHTGSMWRAGFAGFAPGFMYLVGGDHRLHVPRRAEPRTKVPSGAVALAGDFSGVYPRESPGGWQLIGHTDAVLWEIAREQPALLAPGMWIKFRAVG